jgi:predicted nucleic acid-binding protein
MPERPQSVVVNTTPIIALALIGKLDLLRQLYGQVITPSAVRAEVLAGGSTGVGRVELQDAAWLRVVLLQDPRRADLLADLIGARQKSSRLRRRLTLTWSSLMSVWHDDTPRDWDCD